MKKYLLTIAIVITGLATFAQTPTSFQYQAVLRDASGQVLANQDVEIGIAILQGSASGVEVFTETHLVTTNNFGLANLQIGSINPAGMEEIDWSGGPYFVQVSVDGTVMGTSQLLSVPFAMHAISVENDAVDDADADPTNEIQDISISGNELSISSGSTVVLPDEVNDADADPANELQVLSIKGDTILLSGGGYALLPAETDPLFLAWDKSTGVTIFESQVTDLQHFTNADETDPVFETSLAKQITESDTAHWGNDADPINELQFLSIKGDTIFLTNGGYVKLPAGFDGDFNSLSNTPPNLDVDSTDDFDGQYSNLSGAPQNVSEFTNDAGYIINSNDADADPSNEIQVLSISGDTIFLSGGGYAKLPDETDPLFSAWDKSTGVTIFESQISDLKHFTNADESDPVFEQSLAKQITINDTSRWGNDANPTNELQDINLNGTDLSITDGSTVDLSVIQDGTGTDDQLLSWLINKNGELKIGIQNGNSLDMNFVKDGTGWEEWAENEDYVTKWGSRGYLERGTIYDNGNIGIGTNTPGAKLEVAGQLKITGDGAIFTGTYGSGSNPATGPGPWMMWYPAKAAFRAGAIDTSDYYYPEDASLWDKDSIGDYSTAVGLNTKASGYASFSAGYNSMSSSYSSISLGSCNRATGFVSIALGGWSTASGENAIAIGNFASASGSYSTAIGYNSNAVRDNSMAIMSGQAEGYSSIAIGSGATASGYKSLAMGNGTISSNDYSTSIGYKTTASEFYSLAMGYKTTASGWYSNASGYKTTASGLYSSAFGNETKAGGNSSIAMGYKTSASGYRSTTMGNYVSTSNKEGSFIIGDNSTTGVTNSSTDNQMTMRFVGGYRFLGGNEFFISGPVKITDGTQGADKILTSDASGRASWQAPPVNNTLDQAYDQGGPGAGRTIIADNGPVNISGNDGFVSIASSFWGGNDLAVSGQGIRMIWYPKKAAFRAGYVHDSEWNSNNIGDCSVAMGHSPKADGENSVAFGAWTKASGYASTALGRTTTAKAYASLAIGRHNVGNGSTDSWVDSDPIFEIGIGNDLTGNKNAMTVLKNGNVGINTDTPTKKLHVNGNAFFSGNLGIGISSTSDKLHVYKEGDGQPLCVETSGEFSGISLVRPDKKWVINSTIAANNGLGFWDSQNSNYPLIIDGENGYVGIGTISPDFPLHVKGYNSSSDYYAYFQMPPDMIYTYIGQNTASKNYSIVAASRIKAKAFHAVSDRRIKNNIRESNGLDDLKLVNKLKVVDYQYIDKLENGNITKRGFIAQQLEKVMPDAVGKSKAFIPDIYKKATEVVVDSTANTITISTPIAHNLKKGDLLRFISLGGTHEEEVLSIISERTFTVRKVDGDCSQIFVYGKKVDDFRSIDYDQVFSAGIGAIQELSKQNEELKKKNNELEDRLEKLEKLIGMKEE